MNKFNFQAMTKHGFLIIPKTLLQQQIENPHLQEQTEDPAEIELLKDLSEGAELTEEEKLQDDFILKMRECGTKYVAQLTIKYLMDENDSRTPNEFVQALQNAEGGRHDKD